MDKLLLIDGSNLLFQMYYGMPSRIINKTGKPIQGILGFVGAMRKIICEVQPTHICVFFDGEHENPRKALYKEYKSNRMDYSSMPLEETPFSQLEDIYKALKYLKISFLEITEFETDDYIASYTKLYQNQIEIVIASWDSDYFSLISDHVQIYRYRGKKSYFCDTSYIHTKLHIEPNQYIFYKSLIGDHSDNIKGIPKIGPVTAAKIVTQYSSIQNLYENLSASPFERVLIGYKKKLLFNESLIEFQIIDKLPFDMKELIYFETKNTTNDILKEIGVLP